MREIRFRGKAELGGYWVYGDLVHNEDKVYIRRTYWNNEVVIVSPETVGQFTGLYTSKGYSVFEGDIMRDLKGEYYVVKHVAGAFRVYGANYSEFLSCADLDDIDEVVGNKWDNPEMIKETEQ